GRGSPTGVVCYRHARFPPEYRGGFFVADWTFGKVWFLKPRRHGASYRAEPRVFLESVGDNGFAPTALAVHPQTGELFVSIGGRGPRGAVYRVRYTGSAPAGGEAELARLRPPPRSLDGQPGRQDELLRQAAADDALERLRALADLRRHRDHMPIPKLREAVRL